MGWWGESASSSQSHHTHNYTAAFPHPLRSAFALEPNRVGGRPVQDNGRQTTGRTTDRDNNKQTDGQEQTRTEQTDQQTTKAKQAEQTQAKLQRSERQQQKGTAAASEPGRDRHLPRRVLHTSPGSNRPQPGQHAGCIFTRLT